MAPTVESVGSNSPCRPQKRFSHGAKTATDDYQLWIKHRNQATHTVSQSGSYLAHETACGLIPGICRRGERLGAEVTPLQNLGQMSPRV